MAPRRRAGKEPAIEAGPSHQAVEVEEIERMDPLEQLAHDVEDEDFVPGPGTNLAPRSGYYEVFGSGGVGTELRGTMVQREVREEGEDVVDTPLLGQLGSHPSVYLHA